jgi:hypothetical protein
MIFSEKIEEVVEVVDPNIFDTEVVYDQAELNWAPFVPPKSWCGCCFIIPFDNEARAEEIIREYPGLGRPQQPRRISKYIQPSWSRPASLYSSMNSAGMSKILTRTYSGSGIGMSR